MTKQEWQEVEKALAGLSAQVTLRVDGKEVLFQRVAYKNRLMIMTYVDDTFSLGWLDEKQPESRYMRPVSRWAWTEASRRKMKKMNKKTLKRLGYDPNEKIHGFSPLWPNGTAIRRHYQKNFTQIEMLEVL